MIMAHMMKVINKEWTLKEMHASAMIEKAKNRILESWMKLTGAQNPEEVIKRFGRPTIDQSFVNFNSFFSKDKSKPDKEFVNFVNAKLSAVQAREDIIRRETEARSAAVGADDGVGSDAGSGGEEEYKGTNVEERTEEVNGVAKVWAFDLRMNRVFLPSTEFRGSDEVPGEDLGFLESSKTEIHIINSDVTSPANLQMSGNFKLVLLDPPYGVLKNEIWDVKWEREQFKSCVENVVNFNSAEAYTFISFCSAEQISGFLEVLLGFDSENLQVGVTHGAWYKQDHHQACT
jgi:hypothetical protein